MPFILQGAIYERQAQAVVDFKLHEEAENARASRMQQNWQVTPPPPTPPHTLPGHAIPGIQPRNNTPDSKKMCTTISSPPHELAFFKEERATDCFLMPCVSPFRPN